MITQHDDHAGKGCKERLPSFMDLLKHVAKPHAKETFEEQTGVEDIQEEHTKGEQKKTWPLEALKCSKSKIWRSRKLKLHQPVCPIR